MSYETYKILHLAGVLLLFFALGAMALRGLLTASEPDAEPTGAGDEGASAKPPGKALSGAFHGVALLIILVSGFGAIAKAKLGMGGWVHGKLAIWLLIAASPLVFRRMPQHSKALWFVLPLLGAVAAFLAVTKPGA